MMSAATVEKIRRWMLKSPRPETVRVRSSDDDTHDFPVGASVRWASLAESVNALDPVTIQCLNKSGTVERAIKVASWEPDDSKPAATQHEVAPVELPDDPETARFVLVARLLAEAHKFATGVAYDKLASIVETMSTRMDHLEQKADRSDERYRQEMYDRMEDMLEQAAQQAEAGGGSDDIISTFAQAVSAGRNSSKPNGKAPRRRRPTK